jgi:hypothetical protein
LRGLSLRERVHHHILKEINYLPQVQKQLLDARVTALHLSSLKIAQSSHALGNWQAWRPETISTGCGHLQHDNVLCHAEPTQKPGLQL